MCKPTANTTLTFYHHVETCEQTVREAESCRDRYPLSCLLCFGLWRLRRVFDGLTDWYDLQDEGHMTDGGGSASMTADQRARTLFSRPHWLL